MVEPDERWYQTLETLGIVDPGDDGVLAAAFDDLAATYAVGDRRYHTLEHASAVVDGVLGIHETGDAWAPAVLAAWFHDAVYDPHAGPGMSEGASAVFATDVLQRLGAPLSAVAEVARLILLTASHRPRIGDRTGALLCDADLATLGLGEESYDRIGALIREEYAHVPEPEWRAGRAEVLRGFLARSTIFHTAIGRKRWEAQARSNISRELESLTSAR